MSKIMMFCFCVLLGTGLAANAQVVNLGAHAGLNYPNARISNPNFSNYRNYGGAMVGVWGRFGGMFYVQPEVNYNWSKTGVTQNGGSNTPINLHYLQLVASPGIRPLRKKMITIRLGGTASYSFLMAIDNNSVGIRRTDFRAGAFHAGPFIGLDIWRIAIDARYLWGIGDQTPDPDTRWRNNVLQVGLGFRLFGEK